jgi:nitrate/TMAO reductase-like tetraheme cytochrome c subunit
MTGLAPNAIAFVAALLALAFLVGAVFVWDVPDSPRRHWTLLFAVTLVPALALALGVGAAVEDMKRPEFCGSCHVMHPFTRDLTDPESATLAAVHYQNRYILRDQCYTCHTDYGVFGPLRAKLAGVRHLINYETGNYTEPIAIREPYHNANCLHCHGEAKVFRTAHADMLAPLESGDMSCLDCHRPAHPEAAER